MAVYFANPAEFRAWLTKHHARTDELVVGFHKRGTGKPAVHWVVSAKREDTRASRLATLIKDSAAGRTIKPLTRLAKR